MLVCCQAGETQRALNDLWGILNSLAPLSAFCCLLGFFFLKFSIKPRLKKSSGNSTVVSLTSACQTADILSFAKSAPSSVLILIDLLFFYVSSV